MINYNGESACVAFFLSLSTVDSDELRIEPQKAPTMIVTWTLACVSVFRKVCLHFGECCIRQPHRLLTNLYLAEHVFKKNSVDFSCMNC